MIKSICVRLLLWYAVVLAAVVVGFALILYYEVRTAKLSDVDSQLETATAALDASLRNFPKFELTGEQPSLPPGMQMGQGRENFPGFRFGGGPPNNKERPPEGRQPPPGERNGPNMGRERLYSELTLPKNDNPNEGATAFAIWRADGKIMKAQEISSVRTRPEPPRGRTVSQTIGVTRERITLGPMDTVMLVARPIERVNAELASLRWQLIMIGSGLLTFGLMGGWFISRRIFRPVASITHTASQITAENLSERIDTTHIDKELRELAHVLNGTFDRLESAFDRQAQFTADASHELRTPLAVIRSQVDLALSRVREPEEYRNALDVCRKSAIRMTDLVEKLLTLARADAGWAGLAHIPVALEKVFSESVEQFRTLAKEKQIHVNAHFSPVKVLGDATALGQVAANLIANAIHYNHAGGMVRINLEKTETTATLSVTDTGPGIPADALPNLFKRFYRVDKARSRVAGGSGLGLAITEAIVNAHHGTITVESTVGVGTTFRVQLPRENEKRHM